MRAIPEPIFEVYRGRALQLAAAMKLCSDDLPEYCSAVALLAVHSAISYNDVLLILLTGERPVSQDHSEALRLTTKACKSARIEPRGVRNLQMLLAAKTDVSYGDQRVDQERALALSIAAERFQAWVEGSIRTAEGKR